MPRGPKPPVERGGFLEVPPTRVAFVLIPRFNMLALTAAIEPLRIANYLRTDPKPYVWDRRTPEDDYRIFASSGMVAQCWPLDGPDVTDPAPDIIVVAASWGGERYESRPLINWLRRHERKGATIIGLELGVYPLARAGLLDGRPATTHWAWLPGFAEQFPKVDVTECRYTMDDRIMTCAGGSYGADLMIKLIAEDHGLALANEVRGQAMQFPARDGGGPQRQSLSGLIEEAHPVVHAAIARIEEHMDEPLSVPEIAAAAGASQRQLERLFRRHMGCSIVQFSRLLRLQYARVLLTSTEMSIRDVSAAAGFNTLSHFSEAFRKVFDKRPSEYRQTWPADEATPSWPGTLSAFIEAQRAKAARKKRTRSGTQ